MCVSACACVCVARTISQYKLFFANVVIKMLNAFASQLSLTTRIAICCYTTRVSVVVIVAVAVAVALVIHIQTYSLFYACAVAPHANVGYQKTPDQAIDPPSVRRCTHWSTSLTYLYMHICTCEHKSLCGYILASLKYMCSPSGRFEHSLYMFRVSMYICVCFSQANSYWQFVVEHSGPIVIKSGLIKLSIFMYFYKIIGRSAMEIIK